MSAANINAKFNSLRARGFDLGAALGGVQDAGFGGLMRRYKNGNIYWHAVSGAHEVHGGILTRYLNGGGQAANPATSERELGFPMTDEITSDDGQFPYSFFEWGTIAWVRGTGGVRLFGELFNAWKASGGVLGALGHPLQDVTRVGGGRAAYFERGVLWHAEGSNAILKGELITPLLGCPQLVDPAHPPAFQWVRFSGAVSALDARPTLAADLWRGHLLLIPVRGGANQTTVDLVPAAKATGTGTERVLTFTAASPSPFGGNGGVLASSAMMAASDNTPTLLIDAAQPIASRGRSRKKTIAAPVVEVSSNKTIVAPVVDVSSSAIGGTVAGGGAPLVRRTLYSIAYRVPGLAPIIIAPHSVYARSDWTSFNVAHITDLHVSRRIEHYRAQLRKTGVSASDIGQFNNWNDALRDFIRYANHLHSAGLLDAIMATGDLVDYVHEAGDNQNGPGNFGFFEALIRGDAPSPDAEAPKSEALRVPIFTSLGNHDYRANPYALGFKIKVSSGGVLSDIVSGLTGGLLDGVFDSISSILDNVPGLGLVGSLDPIAALSLIFIDAEFQFSGLNVTKQEALKLMGLKGLHEGEWYVPVLEAHVAARQVLVDPSMRDGRHYYFKHINRNRSYFVQMGINRLVMLDTRHDKDITDTVSETLITKLGFGSESSENFLDGSPDSVGINSQELALVNAAIDSAGSNGIVLVGMHAPPLNPASNAMLAHWRETMHPGASPDFVTAFLLGADPLSVMRIGPNNQLVPRSNAFTSKPSWPRNGTPHFHSGPVEDLLDFGISVGLQEELMQLFSGATGKRPVTLVVSGHGHRRFDYRSRWNARSRKLELFTDHYLENPTSYYPIKLHDQWFNPSTYRRRLVNVKAGTAVAGAEKIIHDNRTGATWSDISAFDTPPYAQPLSNASDTAAWWKAHAPVIVQTAALGPATNTRRDTETNSDVPGPNFQGFRIIQISENVIRRVRYITMPQLRASRFRMIWERESVLDALNSGLEFEAVEAVEPATPPTPATPTVSTPMNPISPVDALKPPVKRKPVVRDHR